MAFVSGLRAEDLIMDDVPDVAEAVKRLPRHEQDLRSFRLKRACDLTMKQIILPKDQWTKPEEVSNKYSYFYTLRGVFQGCTFCIILLLSLSCSKGGLWYPLNEPLPTR